ncbi:MAG: 50S ribosomal protein L9 [Candidatus Liberibacter ctenarytainae]|uniref:Large ribosomal subunit protein bL9 n=1 Tax=Candidatus Liberibacter ctenarytainae TaxID=2020335 RepID=A0A937AR52_9HYPH|nr:50S ribosomal protein L9 [Candidatus Liberibacter ctenarytainae]
MELILLDNITNLGPMGKIVKVKNGYARNYLLPFKKALRATKENREYFESQRSALEAQSLKVKSQFEQLSQSINGKDFVIVRAAGDSGHLYGSVSPHDISILLADEGFDIHRGKIQLISPIKSIGIHDVVILLHPNVSAKIKINIARSTEEAMIQAKSISPEEEITA